MLVVVLKTKVAGEDELIGLRPGDDWLILRRVKTITVIATFQARPGQEAALRAALTGLLAPTRQEAGCLNYDLHAATDDPAKFLFHENWTSQAHLDAHLQSPHVKALLPRVGELCPAFPEITIWERIG